MAKAQIIKSKFSSALVDSTGAKILRNSGGTKFSIKGTSDVLSIPHHYSLSSIDSLEYAIKNMEKLKKNINQNHTTYQQLAEALKLHNDYILASRMSIFDETVIGQLNRRASIINDVDDLIYLYKNNKDYINRAKLKWLTGEKVKGTDELYAEIKKIEQMQYQLIGAGGVNVAKALALRNYVAKLRSQMNDWVSQGIGKVKDSYNEIDRARGNAGNSGLKQIREETPTNIRPVKDPTHFTSKLSEQGFKKDWQFFKEASDVRTMTDIGSDKALNNWETLENVVNSDGTTSMLHKLSETDKSLLPKSIKPEDVQSFYIKDFYPAKGKTPDDVPNKRVNIVMVDNAFLAKHYGKGTDSAFSFSRIPDKKGGTLTREWWDNNQSITIYMSKDLLKIQEGFNAMLAKMEDGITSVVHAIKEAPDHKVSYADAQTAMQKVYDEVDYTNNLDNRPLFEFACFMAGTLIHTDQGLVPIEQIKAGDRVLSKSETGEGEMVYKPVVKTMQTENVPVVKLTLKYEGNTLREKRNFFKKIKTENNGQVPYSMSPTITPFGSRAKAG